jgi:hypothetical protein
MQRQQLLMAILGKADAAMKNKTSQAIFPSLANSRGAVLANDGTNSAQRFPINASQVISVPANLGATSSRPTPFFPSSLMFRSTNDRRSSWEHFL